MSTELVTTCDICKRPGEKFIFLHGYEYDGHRNEPSVIYIDLCEVCQREMMLVGVLDWLAKKEAQPALALAKGEV